jgi:methionyl-tRNA formyltransferase
MFHALCVDRRVQLVALATVPPDARSLPAGYVDLGPLAAKRGIPVMDGRDLGSAEALAILSMLDLDLMVVCGWTRLIPAAALAIPRHGCVGFHASMLPAHRGRAPVNWAIIDGARETGATMLMLDPGVDTGAILDQSRVPIGPFDTCGTVYSKVAAAGVAMLRARLPELLTGKAQGLEQAPDDGDVLPRRTPEMGITDWNRAPVEVHDWIRALTHPYPGAFSFFAGRCIRLWRAEPATDAPADAWARARPGEIIGCHGAGVVVGARGGVVRLLTVQDGAAETSAQRWFRTVGVLRGARFEPVEPEVSRWARGLGPLPRLRNALVS